MTDRTIRNLDNLRRSASTARVLNLMSVHRIHGEAPDWAARPLFRNPVLNRSIVIKHRLRRDEIDQFRFRRAVATKIILPIDAADLKAGGRYLFVDQIGFDRMMMESFGIGPGDPDLKTLAVIDRLPGLDPFLLREQLRRSGIEVAPCYFNVSEADTEAMITFVRKEIAPLVELSMGPGADLAAENPIARLTAKILSNSAGEDLSALGQTLRLQPEEYEEGVFCWKGFLYYKWALSGVIGQVGPVMDGVMQIKPHGRCDSSQQIDIARARETVRRRIIKTCEATRAMIKVYDDAFTGLINEGKPTAFRDFLRDAPTLFAKLGERLGAVQHIVSFWSYRVSSDKPPMEAGELLDLLAEFEVGLTGRDDLMEPLAA